ncbi:MAG: ATP-binding protein [Synergistales bacterium]|nr:ATP-binding protein [Synergistales bacterium]MDY6401448.1 ATP-binding protein [Synergistales bacterium]MDY6404082.1 ATP-binding protein [Synergistales bacterium]MDY6410001.1 ATP-binding protein [Synergistales bacterium]MDY6414119.1 ATP-binding protein [Synergistales bacterium]
MNIQLLRDFILEPDRRGGKVTAFCFLTCGIFSLIITGVSGVERFSASNDPAGWCYCTLFLLQAALMLWLFVQIKRGKSENISKISFPFVVLGFIFGLTCLFFLDGGSKGIVPILFILSVVVTPCFLDFWDALIMIVLEISAYALNVFFASNYPGSVNNSILQPFDIFFPVLIVTLTLALLFLFFTYSYKNNQEKLETAISEAQAANEAKSSFLNNMSHEIRTPMNSILGMNEMILREEERPEIREYALVIQRSGRALLGIINDVLDFSKLQDKKMEISPVRYDLSSLINDLVNMAAEGAKKKSLTFTVNVDKTIPRILDGDEYHIRQVMLNILNNAIKYTERGGVTVTMGYEKVDAYTILLKCAVTDTGIGIKSDDLEYIFQPFEHIESSRKFNADGSGLGLSIVQKLLQLMGSELKVESVYHKGSTFSFEVRQTVVKWEPIGNYERAFSVSLSHDKKLMHTFQAPNARVLVVDDADVNLLVFANLLKKTKIKIDTASSGLEMLQMVRMNHYNMIFLDHRMPGMDGIEAFHNMKKMTDGLNFNTPVVALTANAVLGARQLYIDEGFSDYISKPVDTVRLEQVLLEYLPNDLIIRGEDISDDESEKNNVPVADVSVIEKENENKNENDEYAKYKNLNGIDFDAAVTNCGSEDTFIQALEIFYNTLDKKADEIENFEREKDIKNYTVKVHALKSAARLVGALDLSADAKYLEECGDKNDEHEIETKTPALLKKYRAYKEILAQVFGSNDEPDMSLPEISVTDLHEMYSLIKNFAADFDLDNIDRMMEEAKNFRIPEAERERFEKIKECVTNADWGNLEQLL